MLGGVAQNLLVITNTAFLGRLDAVSLGAAALGGVFYMALMMLGFGFSIGVQIIVARRYGEGRLNAIGGVLHHAFYFMIPFAAVILALFLYAGDDILVFLVQSPDVLKATTDFMDIRIWGVFFGFIIYTCQSLFVGIARTNIILPVTCVMVVFNILFDWLLIFGHAGFPEMGIRGAAWASIIAELAGVAVYVYYIGIHQKEALRRFGVFNRLSFDFAVMRHLLKIAVPASLQTFLAVGSWFIFFVMVEKIGERELAISNIGRSLHGILLLPVWGLGAAVNTLVSYSIGCRKPKLIWAISGRTALIAAVAILLLSGLVWIFADFVMSIYTNIPAIGAETIQVMPAIFFSAVFFGVGFIYFNAVSGTGKTHVSLLFEIIAVCIYVAFCVSAVEVWQLEYVYVWLVDGIYGIALLLLSVLYIAFGKWNAK